MGSHGGRDRTSARALFSWPLNSPGESCATSARDRAVLAVVRERRRQFSTWPISSRLIPSSLTRIRVRKLHPQLALGDVGGGTGWRGCPPAFGDGPGAEPGPTVGLVAVYDAVGVVRDNGALDPVQSCGMDRSPERCGGRARARGYARTAERTVIVLGCPADELVSPKAISLGSGKSRPSRRSFSGVDFALYPHPESHTGFGTRLAGCSSSNFTLPATMTLPGVVAFDQYRLDSVSTAEDAQRAWSSECSVTTDA